MVCNQGYTNNTGILTGITTIILTQTRTIIFMHLDLTSHVAFLGQRRLPM